MPQTLANIQDDSTLMLIAGIAIVVLLVIVLVVVVSAMRIRAYKVRFHHLLIETKEKNSYIKILEKEAADFRQQVEKNKKELALFDETKRKLGQEQSEYKALDKVYKEHKKELDKATGTLHALEKKYEVLTEAHETLQEKLKSLLEENSKLRTSNARLLTKLEKEVAKALREQGKK